MLIKAGSPGTHQKLKFPGINQDLPLHVDPNETPSPGLGGGSLRIMKLRALGLLEVTQPRYPGQDQSQDPNLHPAPATLPEILPNSPSNASPKPRTRPSPAAIPLHSARLPPRPLPVPSGRGWFAVPYLAALLVAQVYALHIAVHARPPPIQRTTVPAPFRHAPRFLPGKLERRPWLPVSPPTVPRARRPPIGRR